MTPKGLLRLKDAASTLEELAERAFQPVLDDAGAGKDRASRRLVLCSGKVYYDIVGHERRAERRERRGRADRAAVSVPGRGDAAELVASYPQLEEVVWAQEEPQNMGAWRTIRHRLEEALPAGVSLRYVGRPWRASPSEGYPTAHVLEQDRIVRAALS